MDDDPSACCVSEQAISVVSKVEILNENINYEIYFYILIDIHNFLKNLSIISEWKNICWQ